MDWNQQEALRDLGGAALQIGISRQAAARQEAILRLLQENRSEHNRRASLPKCPRCASPCELAASMCPSCGLEIVITNKLWAVARGCLIFPKDKANREVAKLSSAVTEAQQALAAHSHNVMQAMVASAAVLKHLVAPDSRAKHIFDSLLNNKKLLDEWCAERSSGITSARSRRLRRVVSNIDDVIYADESLGEHRRGGVEAIYKRACQARESVYDFKVQVNDVALDYKTILAAARVACPNDLPNNVRITCAYLDRDWVVPHVSPYPSHWSTYADTVWSDCKPFGVQYLQAFQESAVDLEMPLYLRRGEKVIGPYTADKVRAGFLKKAVRSDDLVGNHDTGPWVLLSLMGFESAENGR